MSAALSGLRAAAQGSELVSNNIANALTPSYAQRSLATTTQANGLNGVRILGINRNVDAGLLADLRLAEAGQGNAQAPVDFLKKVEDLVGLAGDPDGLGGRLASFEAGLISAASRPDAVERLMGTVSDAAAVVRGITNASAAIQDARGDADRTIADQVEKLNTSLAQVQKLNGMIRGGISRDSGTAALEDQRQQVLSEISQIVPIRVMQRDFGDIAIYSEGGAVLLDITAAEIGFDRSPIVTAYQTIDTGTLSGLTLNDQPLRLSALGGGSLEAQFTVRDELGVTAQTQLDAFARDLVERFQDPGVDPTLGVGDAGLFTDSGAAFDPADEVGLATRLTLNAAVDPSQGGEVWRLRDGIGAASPGAVGDGSLLDALQTALTDPRIPASGNFGVSARGSLDLMSQFSGLLAADRASAEQTLSFASSRLSAVTEQQLAQGVDTDQELQNLLILEKAYAANARVIQAADDMLETLVRL
ncbi:flagellar hook-associated protein FlgK [Sulfitobacter albidus]|nr:flagellar hook-associated protein FlgK [Sulfitobacter albidus]